VKGPRADRYTMGARAPESTRLRGVFLARHGETDYNATHRFQGLLPVPLNATGRAQAEQLADVAATMGFVELWASPLPRALETALIVGARIGLEPRTDPRLVETDCGDWTGRLRSEIEAVDPDGVAAFTRADIDFAFPAGESLRDQTTRVLAAVDEIAHGPKPVLVVFHGMAIRLALAALGHPVASVPNAALLDCSGAASSSGRAPDF
jgi:broad specificity phosphatase PhoE